MEGWVDLGDWLHTEINYPSIEGHPSTYQSGSARPRLATYGSQFRRPSFYTTNPRIVRPRYDPAYSMDLACNESVVCVDLLVGLISVSTDLVWHITVHWYAGNAVCKVVRYLQVRTRTRGVRCCCDSRSYSTATDRYLDSHSQHENIV